MVVNERGAAGRPGFVPPRDHQWLEKMLNLRSRIEKAGPLGRAHPFVQIPRVEVSACISQVQRNLPGRVRTVDERKDARNACSLANLANWKQHGRWAGDMAQKDQARACIYPIPEFCGQ